MSLTQEQADVRARGIGGSEAAAVCGLSPWRTPVQVWHEKRGVTPAPDLSDNELIIWGELLEEIIGKEAARRQGWTVHRVRETKVAKANPFMVANIDFRIVGKREGLEVKNTSQWMHEKWGEEGSDDVPLYYLMQGVHYLHVMDYDAWNYAVLLGGNQLLQYRVTRDADTEKRLIALEGNFWECVETGRAPPPVKIEDLTRLWKKTVGRIEATPEVVAHVERTREINAIMKPLKIELEDLKLAIGAYMGEAGDLFDPLDPMLLHATYRAHDETRVDVDAVKKRLKPQIVEAIQCAGQATINRINGKKEQTSYDAKIAMLEQLGADAFTDLIIASLFKTSPVRKFLAK